MWRYAIILILLFACEKQPIEIQSQQDYLIGSWEELDKYKFNWTFKENGDFERLVFRPDSSVVELVTGTFEHDKDSIYLVFRISNQIIMTPTPMNCKIESLQENRMIWSINAYKMNFRRL